MQEQHARAIELAKARILTDSDVLAILVGGSIAKKIERPNSDVDLIVVVSDDAWNIRRQNNTLAFYWPDVCDYPGGYVEGRYISRAFLLAAAERGSEPTRHSFTGVFPIYCIDTVITDALPHIPVYPEIDRQARIDSFRAQFMLNRIYFWHEAIRRDDPYLRARSASDIVLFGSRMILAHNRKLFSCHKRLLEDVESCPQKPENIVAAARKFLMELTEESKEQFCGPVNDFTNWSSREPLSQFLADVELSWFDKGSGVADW